MAANIRRTAGSDFHSDCVKGCAVETPKDLEQSWQALKRTSEEAGAKRYNRVPLILSGSARPHILKLIVLGPFVAFMLLVNGAVLVPARLAASKLADERNVISFFRLLVGLPLMILWGGLTLAALASFSQAWIWAFSLSISLIGLGNYDSVKRSWTVLRNRKRSSGFQKDFEAFLRSAGANPSFI